MIIKINIYKDFILSRLFKTLESVIFSKIELSACLLMINKIN